MYKLLLKTGDIWSIGIICFAILCGRFPFYGDTSDILYKAIQICEFDFPINNQLTDDCKNFIEHLLCKSTTERYSATKALTHKWITDNTTAIASNAPVSSDFSNLYMFSLKNFAVGCRLQNILVHAIFAEMSEMELKDLLFSLRELHNIKHGEMQSNDVLQHILNNTKIGFGVNESNSLKLQMHCLKESTLNLPTYKLLSSVNKLLSFNLDNIPVQKDLENNVNVNDENKVDINANEDVFVTLLSDDNSSGNDFCVDSDENEEELMADNINKDISDPSELSKLISIGKFRCIVKSCMSDSDIEEVIERLDPNDDGNIDLQNIANYTYEVNYTLMDSGKSEYAIEPDDDVLVVRAKSLVSKNHF